MTGPADDGVRQTYPIPDRGRPALTLADALLDLAEAGRRTPCQEPDAWRRFLSEDRDVRAAAALECTLCPVLDRCAVAGCRERFGVWGALDRTPGRGQAPAPVAVACPGCGRTFTPARPGNLHCSPTCRDRTYRQRKATPVTDDTRPQLDHAARCQRRGAPILRASWRGVPEMWCPECGRHAPAGDHHAAVVARALLPARPGDLRGTPR